LVAAINELRDELAMRMYGMPLADLNEKDAKKIQKMFPQKISEAEPVNLSGN
jgi:hypothetical protein